jgi:two-component system nitrate/nitrite response regulator NarL
MNAMSLTELSHRDNKNNSEVPVLIAESTFLAGDLLRRVLGRSYKGTRFSSQVTDPSQLIQATQQFKPDVVLLGIDVAGKFPEGIELLRQIRAACPRVRPILLVDRQEPRVIIEAFRSGVRGVLRRSEPLPVLIKCILAVHRGQVWATAAELELLLDALAETRVRLVSSVGVDLLTQRENEVAALIAEGMTNQEIAEQMQLTKHTVKNYLFKIYEKLGISSRAELILYVFSQRSSDHAKVGIAA